MAFPTDAIAVDHFQGAGNLTSNESDSLRNILNRVRARLVVAGAIIDPDGGGDYLTINAAITAGESIINLFPGKTHSLVGAALSLAPTVSVYISAMNDFADQHTGENWFETRRTTKIVGDITLQDADAQATRRVLSLSGVDLDGNVTGNANWAFKANLCGFDTLFTRNNGDEGCQIHMIGCSSFGDGFWILDNDGAQVTAEGGNVELIGCQFHFNSTVRTTAFLLRTDGAYFSIHASSFEVTLSATFNLLDSNDTSNYPDINWMFHNSNIVFQTGGNDHFVFGRFAGGETVEIYGLTVNRRSSGSFRFDPLDGDPGVKINNFEIDMGNNWYGDGDPTGITGRSGIVENLPANTLVRSEELGAWMKDTTTGMYAQGGRLMFFGAIKLGSAAANHDIGFDFAQNDIIGTIGVLVIETITGAGGATGFGLGPTGTPTKYAQVAGLSTNANDDNIVTPALLGGSEDLKINNDPSGTLAGGAVSVRIIFERTFAVSA